MVRLATRSRNVLRDSFGIYGTFLTPQKVADTVSERELAAAPNSGKKTVEDVRAWLAYNGLVLNAEYANGGIPFEFASISARLLEMERRIEALERRVATLFYLADGWGTQPFPTYQGKGDE